MAITIPVAEFGPAIKSVIPAAATDETVPAICAVHFRWEESGLVIEATNRYIAAQAFIPADSVTGDFATLAAGGPVLVPIADAKAIAKALPTTARALRTNPEVTLSRVADTDPVIRFATTGKDGNGEVTQLITPVVAQFPALDRLIPDIPTQGTSSAAAFDPGYFGSMMAMAKVYGGNASGYPVLVYPAPLPHHPALLHVHPREGGALLWRGLLMPVRVPDRIIAPNAESAA